jgi:hypothetical protein
MEPSAARVLTMVEVRVIITSIMPTPIKKGDKIVIPGAEFMSKEELATAKKNESQRRQMARRRGGEPVEKLTKQEIREKDNALLLETALDVRNMTSQVLKMKLHQLLTDPDQLTKTNLVHLTTAFGTLVDKAQLLSGLATEHIAVSAKIDINISSDEAISQLNKMREKFNESNNT